MGFIRGKLEDALEDQAAVVYDRTEKVFLTWNGSQTFQAFDLDGECLAMWMTDFPSAGTFGGLNGDDTKRAIQQMRSLVNDPWIEEEYTQDGEWITEKQHYLSVYANDQETYLKYGG